MTQFYVYIGIMFIVAVLLVRSCETIYKFELFAVIFYILTGSYNELLAFKIPGLSFFEITPERFLLLTFLALFIRRSWSRDDRFDYSGSNLPWFKLLLNLFVISVVISLLTHMGRLGLPEVIAESLKPINFLLIIYALTLLTSIKTLNTIGKAIVLTAILSSVVSLVQVSIAPDFLRYGELRGAFGDVLRSNGVFETERSNGFLLLTALAWVMTTLVQKKSTKLLLIGLISAAIFTTFHRMSWLMTCIILFIYFVKVEKVKFELLVLSGLLALLVIVGVVTFGMEGIQKSTMVSERISDVPYARLGYYKMVLESIGDQPFFGYGDKNNDAYYQGMLEVTGSMIRATGEQGGIHSGYFSTMFYYGIPCFLFFTAFILTSIFYFWNLSQYHIFFVIPFVLAVLYALGNLTNTVLFKTGGTLYMMHIGMALGALKIREFQQNSYKAVSGTSGI